MKSKNKNHYLMQLVESNAIFDVLDIRQDTQHETITSFIKSCFIMGHLDVVLKIFEQLKTWLRINCSLYPVDYYAEMT